MERSWGGAAARLSVFLKCDVVNTHTKWVDLMDHRLMDLLDGFAATVIYWSVVARTDGI